MLLGFGSVIRLAGVCDDVVRDQGARAIDELGELDINWKLYQRLEDEGFMLLATAEEMNTVAGFAMYTMMKHPHHRAFVAQCVMLNVRVRYRGKGVGRTLVEFCEPELRRKGCTHILHGHRPVYGKEPLFPKIVFSKFDEFYIKELN